MAILYTSLPDYVRGHVEGIVVIKHWRGRTVITTFPDMSRVVYSEKQKAEQKRFAEAVAYAKSIIRDPQRKAAYQAKLPRGKKVFNAAIADYMRGRIDEEDNSSGLGQVQVSYAQTPLILNQNRSRPEPDLQLNKPAVLRPLLTLNSGPPGTSH
ncbi:hypothetical protein [Desertivirga brevis]|uniref:hypothetical protein n=1 Tax=Desertivirga brevis TaxID=2810310 RepID=UPI001A95C2F8|nr:hypothetical protein [Pedobacter sp. SYSU D00873]